MGRAGLSALRVTGGLSEKIAYRSEPYGKNPALSVRYIHRECEHRGREKPLTLWNRIEQWGKHNLLRYTEKVIGKTPVSPETVPFDRIRRVLVIRSHDQLGDFLLSTPALEALRSRFPEAHIGILVRSYCRDAVKNNPCIDSILVHYENGRQWTPPRIRTLAAGLIKKWDMAVVLSSESHSLTSDLWAYLSGAKYIAGSERFVFDGCSRNFFYNLTAPDGGPEKHQSARNLEIVEQFGARTNDLREKVAAGR